MQSQTMTPVSENASVGGIIQSVGIADKFNEKDLRRLAKKTNRGEMFISQKAGTSGEPGMQAQLATAVARPATDTPNQRLILAHHVAGDGDGGNADSSAATRASNSRTNNLNSKRTYNALRRLVDRSPETLSGRWPEDIKCCAHIS